MRFGGSCCQLGCEATYLAELGNVNQTGKVFEIGTFVVEAAKVEVLGVISLAKGLEYIFVLGT